MKRLKRLLLGIAFLLSFATLVTAASPVFLVCGTYANNGNQPTAFLLSIDGAPAISVAPVPFNGATRLHYNVSGLTTGEHSVTIAAKNMQGTSAFSNAYHFTIEIPAVPSQINLSTN